jgi:thiol-disulfide isomerase/thioredoxin
LFAHVTAAVAMACLTWVSGCASTLPPSEPHALLGRTPAPAERPGLGGDFVTVPAHAQVTVVDFWATYCEPCLAVMPAYEALWQEHRADGLVVIGVAADDNPGLVAERLRAVQVTYPNLLDDDQRSLQGAYHVTDLPRTFLFDRKGRLRLVLTGGSAEDAEQMRAGVEVLLAEE